MKTLIIVIANEVKQSPPKGRWSGCYLGVMRLLLSTQDLAMTARGRMPRPLSGVRMFSFATIIIPPMDSQLFLEKGSNQTPYPPT